MRSDGTARPAQQTQAPRTTVRFLAVTVLAIAAVAAAACGGTESAPVATAPAPPADPPPAPEPPSALESPAPAEAAGGNDLPAVTVVDVVSGESLVLSSLAPADRPILLWFWAPH